MKPQHPTSTPRTQQAVGRPSKGKVKAPPEAGRGSAVSAMRRRVSLQAELSVQKQALAEAQDRREVQIEELRAAREALQLYTALYDYAPVGYATLDAKGRIEQINLTGASLLGRERQHLVGVGFSSFLSSRKDRELFHDHLQRCHAAHHAEERIITELHLRSRTGKVKLVQLTTSPAAEGLPGSCLVAITDLTGTRAAAPALRGSAEPGILRNISGHNAGEAEKLFLLQLSEHIRMAADAAELMAQVAAAVAQHFQVARCFLADVDTAKGQFILKGGCHVEGLPLVTGLHLLRAFSPRVVEDVLAGHIVSVPDVAEDPRTAGHAAGCQTLGIGAYVVVPLMRGGKLLAAMAMTTTGSRAWSKAEMALLSTVAERVWLALEKLRLDEELRESAACYREMAERVPVFIFTTTAAGACDRVNQRFLDYTGMAAAAMLGSGWLAALHPEDRAPVSVHWRHSVDHCTPFETVCRFHAADGGHRWFRCSANPVLDEHGGVMKWFGSCTDIDDLMRTQAELAVVNERLEERVVERTAQLASANKELHHEFKERQRLEHEITVISERERRSLGEALHDGVCQHLSGVGMMAATLSDVCEQKSDPETAARLKEITGLIRSATNDARDVARGLHPVDVDADGLVAALRDLTTRYDMPGQTRCVLHCHEPVPVHDNNVAMHLYRIVQEAVVNASRHAQARHISVHLGIRQQDIMLSITDDGTGLPADHDQAAGLGLKLMRYRASSIGAAFSIAARATGGTVVRCSLAAPI